MKLFTWLTALVVVVPFLASAQTLSCKFQKKDPRGTIEETMVLGFDYALLNDGERVIVKNFNLGGAAQYAREGARFPQTVFGDRNPEYGTARPVAARHQGYDQYKGFAKIESDVLWSRFELLVKDTAARLLITTNDGTHTEELFTCE